MSLKPKVYAPIIICLFFLAGCSDENSTPKVKNCRIQEMYFLSPERYSFFFEYNDDGMLREVNSPNLKIQYEYINGKLAEITQAGNLIYSYEYPSETHMRWSSSAINAECNLYHHGDKVDSLVVHYPEDVFIGQTQMKFVSIVEYSANDVSRITNYASNTPEKIDVIKNIEYDAGINPNSLLRQSTGVFTGQDFFDYYMLSFKPEGCSLANSIRYATGWIDPNNPAVFRDSVSIFNSYAYPPQSLYPSEMERWAMQKTYFVYENCD